MQFSSLYQFRCWLALNFLKDADPSKTDIINTVQYIRSSQEDFDIRLPKNFTVEAKPRASSRTAGRTPKRLTHQERYDVLVQHLARRLRQKETQPSRIVENLNHFCSLLKLSHLEKIAILHSLDDIYLGRNLHGHHYSPAKLAKTFDATPGDVEALYEHGSNLLNAGIFVPDSEGVFSSNGDLRVDKLKLNSSLKQTFYRRHADAAGMIDDLLGTPIATELGLADFDYVKWLPILLEMYRGVAAAPDDKPANSLIYGPVGTGKTELVAVIAASFGYRAYSIGIVAKQGEPKRADRLQAIQLAARVLQATGIKALLAVDECDDILRKAEEDENSRAGSKAYINSILLANRAPTIFITNNPGIMDEASIRRLMPAFPLLAAPRRIRASIIAGQARKNGFDIPPDEAYRLAKTYPSQTPGMTDSHFRAARRAHIPAKQIPDMFDYGVRALNGGFLDMPILDQLCDPFIATAYRVRDGEIAWVREVVENAAKLNHGLNFLLSGPQGVGKTQFALSCAKIWGREVNIVPYEAMLGMNYRENIASMIMTGEADETLLLIRDIAGVHTSPHPQNDPLFKAIKDYPHGVILTQNSSKVFTVMPPTIDFDVMFEHLDADGLSSAALNFYGDAGANLDFPEDTTLADLSFVARQSVKIPGLDRPDMLQKLITMRAGGRARQIGFR